MAVIYSLRDRQLDATKQGQGDASYVTLCDLLSMTCATWCQGCTVRLLALGTTPTNY